MAAVEVPVEAVDALEGALTEMEGWSQMLTALGPDAMGWLDGEWLELLARTIDRWADGARPDGIGYRCLIFGGPAMGRITATIERRPAWRD